MNNNEQFLKEISTHLMEEAKLLRDSNKKLKECINGLMDEIEHLGDIIFQVEEFSKLNEDEKTAELLNLRENLKMAEELCGIGTSDTDEV